MKKVNFIPKTDIEEYLINDFNIEIFDDLNENEDWKGLFDPLEFLNLLYEQFEIIHVNKEKPISVIKHLLKLDLDKHKLYYLLYFLTQHIYSDSVEDLLDNQLSICGDFIQKEYKKIKNELFPKAENEPASKYSFEKVKKHLETISFLTEKLKYLIEIKTEYRQNTNDWDARRQVLGNTFDVKCDMEISKIKSLLALEQPPTQPKAEPQLGRYSNSQLVLIFYYFFKFNGIEPRVNSDIAPIAKFIHLIVGKEYKNITSSDFYQKLREVPNFKTDKELIKDLNKIKPQFKKVELNEIVKMIDNEIDQARTELKQRK